MREVSFEYLEIFENPRMLEYRSRLLDACYSPQQKVVHTLSFPSKFIKEYGSKTVPLPIPVSYTHLRAHETEADL
eukprot:3052608-Amphidinium_carterae.1